MISKGMPRSNTRAMMIGARVTSETSKMGPPQQITTIVIRTAAMGLELCIPSISTMTF
jgi:hypothetical protein